MKKLLIIFTLLITPFILAQECQDGQTESCPTNKGICAGGIRICFDGIWGPCSILPKEEICNNNLDDDCDGLVDEECVCKNNETRQCQIYTLGICSSSKQTCINNKWSDCDIKPQNESCNNNLDDDCDGYSDIGDQDCFDENHCRNSKKDYDEKDIDCGGSLCQPCPTCTDGKKSARLGERKVNVVIDDKGTISDCGGLCPTCPTCNDGIKNQDEEDIDCGGPCPTCQINQEEIPKTTCGNNICDSDEDNESCPRDCKKNSNFLIYFLILLILIILLFIAFVFASKLRKKKPKETPPVKLHSSLFKPLPKNIKSEKLAEELKKIR